MRLGLAVLATLFIATAATAEQCAEPLAAVFERTSPAVVSIQAMKINKAKPQRRFETIVGSGVVIDKDGQILTNAPGGDGAAALAGTPDPRHQNPPATPLSWGWMPAAPCPRRDSAPRAGSRSARRWSPSAIRSVPTRR